MIILIYNFINLIKDLEVIMRGVVQPIRGGMGVQSGYGQMNQLGSNVAGGFEEVVNVPNSLSEFASRPQFQQILLKVKQQTSINYIDLKKDTATLTVISITINAPTAETATNARRLVETHFKNQIKIIAKDNAGLFYSFKTLIQLIKDSQDQNINLPIIEVLDYPSLSYRSVHIDVKHHTEKKEYYFNLMPRHLPNY